MVVPSGCDLVCQPRYAGTAKVLRVSRRMVRDRVSFFMVRGGIFGIRDSGFGTPIIFGVGDSRSRVHRLIAGAVAARVVAAAPEGLSFLSAFLDYALEHRFATFGAEWCIG